MPGFDCLVVTLSNDSPEAHGYTDIAIGHFPDDADFDAEIERIICGFWSRLTAADPDQAREYLFIYGYIDAGTAYLWREEVWAIGLDGEPIGEETDEEEALDEAGNA